MNERTAAKSGSDATPRLKHHLSNMFSGGTPETGNEDYWSNDDTGVAWVAIGDMSGRERVESTEKRITEVGRQSRGLSILPKGTLIYSMYASLGHVAELAVPATINQALLGFEFRPGVYKPYVKWQLRQLQPRVVEEASSSTQDNLNAEKVRNLPIPLPPLPQQRAIADYLDRETARLDSLVAAKERVLELLAEKRRALITRAVTHGLPVEAAAKAGLDPRATLRDSGIPWLGKIPEHWEIWKMGHIALVGNGSTPNRDNPEYWLDGSIPWLNSSVVNQEEVTASDQFVTDTALRECHLPLVRPGSVLVGITGQGKTRGQAVVLSFEATINQHLAFMTPRADRLDTWFLRWALLAAYEFLRSISDDAGGTKGALTCEEVAALRVPLPPIAQQRAIVDHVATETAKLDGMGAATERTIALLKERRAALIAAAVTGQIDVGSAAYYTDDAVSQKEPERRQ